ncbi:hypothetical protein B0I35DRAFT_403265 [Stachybotrys elegans]|uniref:Zn(2)-C6 fungal-type domain-containing protein n=1 Tax=Stachybotrys elegans TaxID=80388 RepID=A0A8K0T5J5_9HYPO|nr:hypothetical protein B0I35DRAFT_403265 [Stachybotrys elegans]
MRRHLIVVAAIGYTLAQTDRTITCYGINGFAYPNNTRCPGSNACCNVGDDCLSNRLCHRVNDGPDTFVRGPCAIDPYDSGTCGQICLYNETTGVLPRVRSCADGSLCCDNDERCCDNGDGIFLGLDGRITDSAPSTTHTWGPERTDATFRMSTASETTSAPSTSSTSSEAAPTSPPADGSQGSDPNDNGSGLGIGLGVGLGLGIALLLAAGIWWWLKRKRASPAEADKYHGEQRPELAGNENKYRPELAGSEYRYYGEQRPELAGTGKAELQAAPAPVELDSGTRCGPKCGNSRSFLQPSIMSGSPPLSPHDAAHAYATNGLDILQAASDAAQAISNTQALQNAAAAAEAVTQPMVQAMGLPPSPEMQLMRDPTINPKLTRLRRACDMCSMRKVKCDDQNVPCRPCRELGVDCTFNRETKRRGPPNKHAEAAKAAKRARQEGDSAVVAVAAPFSISPSPQTAAKALMNISSDALDADSIAPMPVLELLIDDFFTYIHPLAPLPHEPTFRQSFANREDRTKPEFLGLLASMIGALVASFPRCVREHLKAQHSTHLFPRAVVMVERCRDIALTTRGSKWVLKQPKTLDDASTSYFLALASAYIHQHNACSHFMNETLTLIRELGFTRPKHPGDLPTFGSDVYSADPLPFNHVKDQIGKRIFWCLLLGVRSVSQIGSFQMDVVIAPSTPNLPYPAYPENVDDICVLANEIIHQPEGTVTLLTGFRIGIDVYTTMNGIVSLELAYGMSTLPWADQRLLLRDGLLAAKSIIETLPPELQLGNHGDSSGANGFDDSGLSYVPPVWPSTQPSHDVRNVIKLYPTRRRQLQYEIQKANIFISELATRSYFVELYFNLRDVWLAEQASSGIAAEDDKSFPVGDDKEIYDFMAAERELIVENLLMVLGSISQRSLEPNGGSLIFKIRQVASTLLNDAPERKGPMALKSEDALAHLIEVLVKLENTGPSGQAKAGSTQMTDKDEEEEMRHWADLREYQLRYSMQGLYGL